MAGANGTAGSVLRIERSSIHDGQGLRTVIFFKGCSLDCAWCSTPESKEIAFEKGYAGELCAACGKCVEACPQNAVQLTPDCSKVSTDAAVCIKCFCCAEVCPSRAVKRYGSILSVSEVMRQVSRDEIFYYHSGGGVTLSGGEPLNQAEFAARILQECRLLGINTAMESSFYCDYESVEKILPWLDTLYVDIKHMDSHEHRSGTGSDNSLILDNIRRADQSRFPLTVVVRIPLIPGFNDGDRNLLETLQFCKGLEKLREIELLPYHRLGSETYAYLGRDYSCRELIPQSEEQLLERVSFLRRQKSGIKISAGSGFSAE